MRVGVVSDVGKRRATNEDGYLVKNTVFAVADGMGGHSAGEVASAIALKTVKNNLRKIPDPEAIPELLTKSIEDANTAVFKKSEAKVEQRGMGTTLTIAVLSGKQFFFGHVGDSRAYLLRESKLSQLTEDHSYVAEMVKEGALSPQEAEVHPQRSVLTRALGVERKVQIDTSSLEIMLRDKILFCTDGLTAMLGNQDIEELLNNPDDPQVICQRLVDTANKRGGDDNITVILIEIDKTSNRSKKIPWWKRLLFGLLGPVQ